MELKVFQKKVMDNLSSYLSCLNRSNHIISAWREYWFRQDINVGLGGVPSYNDTIAGVPHVCMKVPTGGGKTFMACAALKRIFDAMPLDKERVVIWLVPSDSILTQTIRNLSNPDHPYRQRLDADFAGRVGIYTKEQLLEGQNFSPDTVRELLTVCILSYSSLRINSRKKDVRKVYQENGNLLRFANYFSDDSVLLADTPDTALIQVLRQLSPVTVVDESHNASSDLSVEMLENLNPSFILDLTATPRENSNIISYVDARELKKENMVKLPVVVYNRTSRQNVIQDAIHLRAALEAQAKQEQKKGGEYIRPILLFQAQPNINEDSETFERIKSLLLTMGISEDEIAIKTSNVDTLQGMDLMSPECSVRYIITVNALKEGWDCPFAYVLASLANKTSKVDVEQILGRILRQPYVKQHRSSLLNTSYVITCSSDFKETLESIVSGLNQAGFSRKDYRIGQWEEESHATDSSQETIEYQQQAIDDVVDQSALTIGEDNFSDVVPEEIKITLEPAGQILNNNFTEMLNQAEKEAQEYSSQLEGDDHGFTSGELGEMLNQNAIQPQYVERAQEIKIPQFFLKTKPDLFGEEYELLEPENLSDGFSLAQADAQISFELSTGEIYRVDIQDQGEAVPKYRRASKAESQFIRDFLATLPEERRIKECTDMICHQINRNNLYATSEIESYVKRIVSNMTDDELSAMETAIPTYAARIQQKITSLELVYREQQFYKWLDSGKIACKESYSFPPVITPANTIDTIPLSLYEAEKDDMNRFEQRLLDTLVSLENIEWWHRIIDRKGFRLNCFINHYPDFVILTKRGTLILIEAKGDYLDGDDSRTKLKVGRSWQALSGRDYRYFMVFQDKDLGESGAYKLDEIVDVIREL